MGTVNPIGHNVADTWKNAQAGVSGVGRISRFDPTDFRVQIAAEVKDFDAEAYIPRKEARRLDRNAQLFWAAAAQALPRSLKTPTQCVGCHFGVKVFEPERSFPAAAPPGPHGPRAFYVDEALRDREPVVFFDEHTKRSDTVLGIYNTLFVARLRADRRAGALAAADARLLESLGL